MRSSNRQYLASMDHVRGFAAVLVVFYHAELLFSARLLNSPNVSEHLYSRNPLLTLVGEGHTAVTLFMVLSGFIFTIGTLGRGVSFPRFMGNRLLRIYPLFLLLVILGSAFRRGAFTPGSFFLTVFGLTDYTGAMNLGAVSAMFWAVGIEMQFYLMFPLLNKILSRSGVVTFVRLLAGVVVARAVVWAYAGPVRDPQASLYFNLAGRLDDFLIGMIAAWLFVRHRDRFRGWWKVAASLAVVVATLWGYNQAHGSSSTAMWRLGWVDWEAGMWALAILTYAATLRSNNLISRAVAKVGEMSFSIYLLHFVLLQLVMRRSYLYVRINGLSPQVEAILTAALVLLPMVLIVSWFTYNGVEKPFLNLRMTYLLPMPATPDQPPAVPERQTVRAAGANGNRHKPDATAAEGGYTAVPSQTMSQLEVE